MIQLPIADCRLAIADKKWSPTVLSQEGRLAPASLSRSTSR